MYSTLVQNMMVVRYRVFINMSSDRYKPMMMNSILTNAKAFTQADKGGKTGQMDFSKKRLKMLHL